MNWKHSLYQIYAITLGQSFTLDEAYRLLKELREDRLFAIASAFAETHRAKAKVIDAKRSLRENEHTKGFAAHKRRSEAAILETEARFIIAQPCLDMARVELAFIEQLIKYIEDSGNLIYDDFAVGSQKVQPLEYAFDYTWSLLYEGPHGDLMRNIWINPHAEKIIKVFEEINKTPSLLDRSREKVAKRLASVLFIHSDNLAITVNIQKQMEKASQLLLTYEKSHVESMQSLRDKAHEQLSGNSSASVGLEGSD